MTKIYHFKVDKLIRDKLPQIIDKEPEASLTYRILSDEEYRTTLKKKLIEEATEVEDAFTKEDLMDELADVVEVFDALLNVYGLSLNDIRTRQAQRKKERGGFQERIYCMTVSVGEKNPKRLDYYKHRPNQYPEIK